MDKMEEGARKILASLQAVYVPTHRYVPADPRRFRHLDLRFYDRVRRELEGLGFRHLMDKEDLTISESPGTVLARIMLRTLASADGAIMACAYDPKFRFPHNLIRFLTGTRLPPVIDLETEFDDGAFLVSTTVTGGAQAMQQPPMVLTEYFPPDAPVARLVSAHRQRIEAYRQATGGVSPRAVFTPEDNIASQNRLNALKAAFRAGKGMIGEDELRALANGRDEIARRMHARIAEIRSESETP